MRFAPARSEKQIALTLHRLHAGQLPIANHPARFRVVMCGRRFGKSAMGIRWACDMAIAGKMVGWFAPNYKYAGEAWREMVSRLGAITSHKSEQDQRLELVTGGVIEVWTLDKDDPARGRKYHAAVIDEAGIVRDLLMIWQSAIRLTLADYEGRALFLGTPKGRQHGFVQLFNKGLAQEDGWMSFRASMADNPYIPRAEIEAAKRDLPPAIYDQEVLGIPADDGGNPFGVEAIKNCTKELTDPDNLGHKPIVWGWDLARAQDWTVGIAIDAMGNVVRTERWQLVSWSETVKRITEMTEDAPAWGDATGVGDPIIERLQEAGVSIVGFMFTQKSKQSLMERLATAIQHGEVNFPPGVIPAELDTFTYEYTAGGVRYTAPDGLHDDAVMSLGLAVYGFDRIRPTLKAEALAVPDGLRYDPNAISDYIGDEGSGRDIEGFGAQLPLNW